MSLQPEQSDEEEKQLQIALAKIAAGRAKVSEDTSKDNKDRTADKDLDRAAKQAAVDNDWLLIELRKSYGRNLIRFMWAYFVVTFGLIIINAYKIKGIEIDKSILVAAIGGTAASVLGVVGTIASGLFKPPVKK